MTDKPPAPIQDTLMDIVEHLETLSKFLLSIENGNCDGCLRLAWVARDNIKLNMTGLLSCLICLTTNIDKKGISHGLH